MNMDLRVYLMRRVQDDLWTGVEGPEHEGHARERVFELCGVPQTRDERVPQVICLYFSRGRRWAGDEAAADGAAGCGP